MTKTPTPYHFQLVNHYFVPEPRPVDNLWGDLNRRRHYRIQRVFPQSELISKVRLTLTIVSQFPQIMSHE